MKVSQQIARRLARARDLARPEEVSGKVRIITFNVLVTEPETNFRIAYLPGGKGRLLTTLGRISVVKEGKAVGAVLSLGHEGYTSGTSVKTAPSADALSAKVKVNGMAAFGTFKDICGFQYDAMNEIGVTVTTDEPIEAGAEIHGMLFYVVD